MDSPHSPVDQSLKIYESNAITDDMKRVMNLEKLMIKGIQEKIADKEKQIESQLERIKSRDLLRVSAND